MTNWAQGILAGVAGGMAGGGTAWQTQARDEEKDKRAAAMETLRSKNDMDRQVAMEAIRAANVEKSDQRQHGYRKDELETGHGYGMDKMEAQGIIEDLRTSSSQTFTADQAGAQREFLAGESKADRANRLAAAGISARNSGANKPTLVTAADGSMIQVHPDGTTRPVMIGDQPLKGPKDASQLTVLTGQAMIKDAEAETDPIVKAEKFKKVTAWFATGGQKPGEVADKPTWEGLSTAQRDATVGRLNQLKSDPLGLAKAIKDAEKGGVPVDILAPFKPTGEPPPAPPPAATGGGVIDRAIPSLTGSVDPYGAAPIVDTPKTLAAQEQLRAARANEIRALTPEIAAGLNKFHADRIKLKYGDDLPENIRAILNRAK